MQILRNLHSNCKGIEKTRVLVCKSVHWVNMDGDIKNTVKHCSTYLEYQNTKLQEKTMPYKVSAKSEVIGADIFMITNENLLGNVDYYRKFPVVKKVERLSAEDLI